MADRILVKKITSQDTTASGIYIGDPEIDKLFISGKVLSIGYGKYYGDHLVPVAINIGDIVLFGKYAGVAIDEERIILREDEVIGIAGN